VSTRVLIDRDEPELERFVLMAAFNPDAPIPAGARAMTHVRRWLDGWSALETGVCWEENDRLVGAAWARRVEPVLVKSPLGQPIPEVLIAVDPERRGQGIGRTLMEELVAFAEEACEPGLCLTVGEQNAVAVRFYERVGFVAIGDTRTPLITMVLELED